MSDFRFIQLSKRNRVTSDVTLRTAKQGFEYAWELQQRKIERLKRRIRKLNKEFLELDSEHTKCVSYLPR